MAWNLAAPLADYSAAVDTITVCQPMVVMLRAPA